MSFRVRATYGARKETTGIPSVGLSCLKMAMTPTESFRAATVNGARALGLENRKGRITKGFDADLILWEAENEAQVVYEFENHIPRTVIAAGRVVTSSGA